MRRQSRAYRVYHGCRQARYTVCIRDLNRLYLNLGSSQFSVAASKNQSHFKCGQKGPENNDHAYFAKFKSKSMIHYVGEKLKNNDENKCSGL